MNIRSLTLHVPPGFAEVVRQRQLIELSIFSMIAFAIAWLFNEQMFAVVGYILIARVAIILAFSKAELIYKLTPYGVRITVSQPLPAVILSIGLRFWLGWPANGIVTVEHRYYGDHSVVLLRTKATGNVYCLPVAPSDVTTVADFLLSHPNSKPGDDEQPTDIIK
jgi:hypothetical protein